MLLSTLHDGLYVMLKPVSLVKTLRDAFTFFSTYNLLFCVSSLKKRTNSLFILKHCTWNELDKLIDLNVNFVPAVTAESNKFS